MTLLPSSPGQCLVCRKDISRKSAEVHLISHKKKKSPKPSAYLIEVTAEGHPEYWMYLSSLPDATLEDIDLLLKDIWMGDDHISSFTIEGEEYTSYPDSSGMKVRVGKVFRPGMTCTYTCNYSSPTVLHLVVLDRQTAYTPSNSSICVVARNSRISYDCDICGSKADFFCDECYHEGGTPLICKHCLLLHECSYEEVQVIPDSPLFGIEYFAEEPDRLVRWYPDGWTGDEIISPELYELLDRYFEKYMEEDEECDLQDSDEDEDDEVPSVPGRSGSLPPGVKYDRKDTEEMKGTITSGSVTTLIDLYIKELRRSYGIEPKTPPQQEPLSIDRYDTIRAGIEDFCKADNSPSILEGCILMLDNLAANLKSPLHKGDCLLWSSAIIFTQYQENGLITKGKTTSCAEMIAAFFGVKPNMTRIRSSDIRTALDMKLLG